MSIKASMPVSVLFVDDEEKACKYFSLAMADAFDVKTAGSADEALAVLAEFAGQIAIIVSDQRMPETTGVQLLKTVREQYPHIVRLLTTAYTDLEDAIEAINRGEILRYIQKPWDIGTLKAELKHAMNYFQLRSERDALLEEKLSVRHSMAQIERISQLLLFAEAIPYLRFTRQAMRRFVDQLLCIVPPASAQQATQSQMLDLWSQTLYETARSRRFIRTVMDQLGPLRQAGTADATASNGFTTRLDLPALLRIMQDAASVGAPLLELEIADGALLPHEGIVVDEGLFQLMLTKLFAVLGAAGARTVAAGIAATGTAPNTGMQLTLEFGPADFSSLPLLLSGPVKQEVPAAATDLLLALLACIHHGGSLDLATTEGGTGVALSLPADPAAAAVPADDEDWHEKMLGKFEPEIF